MGRNGSHSVGPAFSAFISIVAYEYTLGIQIIYKFLSRWCKCICFYTIYYILNFYIILNIKKIKILIFFYYYFINFVEATTLASMRIIFGTFIASLLSWICLWIRDSISASIYWVYFGVVAVTLLLPLFDYHSGIHLNYIYIK